MLIWNPLLLGFDPGFALSSIATAGLIWLAPLLENRMVFIRSAFWKNAIATTAAAQIAVLPILLYETGTLSLVSIPANLAVMLMVPAAMAFSAIAGFAGMFLGDTFFAIILAAPAYALNAYLIEVARFSTSVPFAAFAIPAFPFWLVLVLYAVLIWYVLPQNASQLPSN
jgi:competence protein ComEC